MAELEYSTDALNVLSQFYSTDTMLFVEGDEDIPFWEYLFDKFSSLNIKIQAVGGKPKLKEYADRIISGKASILIGMDSDYSIFDNDVTHRNIIRTYGYSIENTIISISTIKNSIRTLGKVPNNSVKHQDIESWFNCLLEKIEPLFIYDIGNHIEGHGVEVAGCNCGKFMKNNNSPIICGDKINKHIRELEFTVPEYMKDHFFSILKNNSIEMFDIIRGHFIFSAVHKFIQSYIKNFRSKVSISIDSMYSTLILSFERLFNEQHPHYEHYESSITNIDLTNKI